MTKAETDLGKAIAKKSYVELKTKTKREAAEKLARIGLVKVYEHEGAFWAKAATHEAKLKMAEW